MKKSVRKLSILFIVAMMLILTACGGGKDSANKDDNSSEKVDVVKIGAILPLTGSAASIGEMSKRAMELAVEEINENGGIESLGGAKLELVFGDSEGKPQVGVSETERLITKENVAILTGAYQSGVTLPASEVAERYKKVWLASVASEVSITERGFKYVFRSGDTTPIRVKAQVEFMKDLQEKSGVDLKTVALVYENTAWGQGTADSWKELLPEAGFEIVLDEAYDASSADLTPVVTKVKNANPDVVLLCSYVSDATLLANGFWQQKVQPKAFIATSGGYADPEYIRNTGEATLGYFDYALWEGDVNRPNSKETNEKFYEKYGVYMNGAAVQEYSGIYIIKDALERAGSLDSEALRKAFAETNLTDGPTQIYSKKIHFDETGTFPDPSFVFVQFRKVNGNIERVTVWPESDAREGYEPIFPYDRDKLLNE